MECLNKSTWKKGIMRSSLALFDWDEWKQMGMICLSWLVAFLTRFLGGMWIILGNIGLNRYLKKNRRGLRDSSTHQNWGKMATILGGRKVGKAVCLAREKSGQFWKGTKKAHGSKWLDPSQNNTKEHSRVGWWTIPARTNYQKQSKHRRRW